MNPARLPRAAGRRVLSGTERLACGSTLLVRGLAARLADWVARGRRDDLTGWRAALGPLARLTVLAGLGWVTWRLVQARVWWINWGLAGLWCGVAWHLTRAPKEQPEEGEEEAAEESPALPDRDAVVALLRTLIGTGRGVHLSTLLAHLQEHGQAPDWTVTDVRLRLEALHIPVEPKLKVDGVPKRGVAATALDALTPVDGQEESPNVSPSR